MSTDYETRRSLAGWLVFALTAPAVWLERARGQRRVALIGLYLFLASLLGLFAARHWMLRDIPNRPDPFADLDGLTAPRPDTNAFSYYQAAFAKLRSFPAAAARSSFGTWSGGPPPSLSLDDPTVQKLLDENSEVLELWRRGSEQDIAVDPRLFSEESSPNSVASTHWWQADFILSLLELEADRLEAKGDVDDAWRWHLAAVRSSRHLAANGAGTIAVAVHSRLSTGLNRWASNPRVDVGRLKRAKRELEAIEARSQLEPLALRVVYRQVLSRIESPTDYMRSEADAELNPQGREDTMWYHTWGPTKAARWYLKNEPERSRRATRLLFENWRRGLCTTSPERDRRTPIVVPQMPGSPMSSLAIFVDVSKLPPAGSAPPVMQVFPGKLVATRVPVAVPTDQDGAAIFAALNSTLHLKRSLGDAATTVMPFNSTGDFASMIDTEIESRSQPSESAANVGDAPR